jgi:hypothetical protein
VIPSRSVKEIANFPLAAEISRGKNVRSDKIFEITEMSLLTCNRGEFSKIPESEIKGKIHLD